MNYNKKILFTKKVCDAGMSNKIRVIYCPLKFAQMHAWFDSINRFVLESSTLSFVKETTK